MSFYDDAWMYASFWDDLDERAKEFLRNFEHQNCRSAVYYDKEPAIMICNFWGINNQRVTGWYPLEPEEKEVTAREATIRIEHKFL